MGSPSGPVSTRSHPQEAVSPRKQTPWSWGSEAPTGTTGRAAGAESEGDSSEREATVARQLVSRRDRRRMQREATERREIGELHQGWHVLCSNVPPIEYFCRLWQEGRTPSALGKLVKRWLRAGGPLPVVTGFPGIEDVVADRLEDTRAQDEPLRSGPPSRGERGAAPSMGLTGTEVDGQAQLSTAGAVGRTHAYGEDRAAVAAGQPTATLSPARVPDESRGLRRTRRRRGRVSSGAGLEDWDAEIAADSGTTGAIEGPSVAPDQSTADARPVEGYPGALELIHEPGFNSWNAIRRRIERLRGEIDREPRHYELPLDGYESLDEEAVGTLDLPTLVDRYQALQGGIQETADLTVALTERHHRAQEEYRRLGKRADTLNRDALVDQEEQRRAQRAHLAGQAAMRRAAAAQPLVDEPVVEPTPVRSGKAITATHGPDIAPSGVPITNVTSADVDVTALIASTAVMQRQIAELTALMGQTRRPSGTTTGPPSHAQMAHPVTLRLPTGPASSRDPSPVKPTPTTSEEAVDPNSSL